MLLGYGTPKRGLYRILYPLFHCLPMWRPRWMDWCLPLCHGFDEPAPALRRRREGEAGWLARYWPVCHWTEGGLFSRIWYEHHWYCPARIPVAYLILRWKLSDAFYWLMDRCYWRLGGMYAHRHMGNGKFFLEEGCLYGREGIPVPPGKWEIVGRSRPDEDAVYARPSH